jgi:hypothetical protein
MRDSLPSPPWGIPSYDERDLDALLSGEVTDIPVALRPLADALTALKGPPTPAELRGGATIRAEFLAQTEFGPFGPAQQGALAAPGRRAETLKLSALQPGSRPRRAARHRVRRPANRRFGVFLAAAAVAAIAGAAAFTGNLPGPHLLPASSRAASSAVRPTSPALQGRSASPLPTAPQKGERSSPSSSPSAGASPNGSALCRTFFWSFEHPVNGQQWRKSRAYGQLSVEAGGPGHILSFCQPYIKVMFPHGMPVQFPGSSTSGQQGSGNGSQSGDDGNTAPGQNAAHYPAAQGGL